MRKATLKPRTRLSPAETVRFANATSPEPPPARMPIGDRQLPYSTRMRASTLAALEEKARAEGVSMKLVICRALADAGVSVAPADLEDGTPRRRRPA